MREVLLIITDDYAAGGVERSAVAVAQCLQKGGYRVTVYCFKLFPNGLAGKYPFIRVIAPERRSKLLFWISTLIALRRQIRTRAPHALIALGRVPSILLPFISAFLKVPLTIGSERTYPPSDPPGPLLRLLRRIAFRRLDFIVCQTELIKAWFRDMLDVREGKLVVIPNVIPQAAAERRSEQPHVPPSGPSLVAIGRLHRQKGFSFALEIVAKVIERIPQATLSIAGEGPLRDALEQQARQLGIAESVRFLGRVRDLTHIWESAAVLLFPSLYEGFPNALAEAMANGVPAVSFDCPTGPSELIESGVNGYLVRVGDVEGAAEYCIDLLTHDEKRRTFGERAMKVTEDFSADRIGLLWRELMEKRRR